MISDHLFPTNEEPFDESRDDYIPCPRCDSKKVLARYLISKWVQAWYPDDKNPKGGVCLACKLGLY